MKVYVAARFFEKPLVKEVYKKLIHQGHTITADWTLHKNAKPYDKNIPLSREYAIEDIDGVRNSDVFILLTSEEAGAGVSTELGVAIASYLTKGKPKIYVVGEFLSKNFCYFHPVVTHKNTLDEVLSEL